MATRHGFTLIEILIVLAILSLLILLAISAWKTQLIKARDARRKADLAKIKKVLEDYLNDEGCYPNPEKITIDGKICNTSFSPYLSTLPCDPINNNFYNYFYSYDQTETCKTWYKIYARLENSKDPIISKVGCRDGCGPSGNYNYWVSSPNVTQVEQISSAEDWWPEIGGGTTPTPSVGGGPTLSPTPTVSGPTLSPTPTELLPSFTPTPTILATPTPSSYDYYGCFSGVCRKLLPDEDCSPKYLGYPNCDPGGVPLCGTPENPQNECL